MGISVSDLITIGLLVALEGLLSADNALVIAIIVLGLPKGEHQRALRLGLIGAFAFRIVATMLAVYLIQLTWVKAAGGLYLLYLSWAHFSSGRSAEERRTPPQAKPWFGLSAFWATVLRVELVNLAFSIDSILVAVAVSPKLWVVLTGGILGIIAMRLVVGQLLALIQRYPAIVDGAFIIIAWVGIKLLLEFAHAMGWVGFEIPKPISLGLIAVIFVLSFLYARQQGPAREQADADAEASAVLTNTESDGGGT